MINNQYKIEISSVRLIKERTLYSDESINNADDAIEVISTELSMLDRELFGIINLNVKGQAINFNIVSMGTLDSTIIHPREIFKGAILSNAYAIILIHNHPSGDTHPSSEDIKISKNLKKCGDILDIKVIDSLIVSSNNGEILSLQEKGLLV